MTRTFKYTEPVPDVKTHFLSQLIRHFNIQNLPRYTHRVFREALLKEKL